jgi:hypothetical protein
MPGAVFFIILIVGDASAVHLADPDNIWHTTDPHECVLEGERLQPLFPDCDIKVMRIVIPEGYTKETLLVEMLVKWRRLLDRE